MLKVTEIYRSLQGESSFAGFPCTFIRLTGCPLRCKWCDTAYSFEGGTEKSVEDIVAETKSLDCSLVELTGGEPLAQAESRLLIQRLIEENFKVLIETSGSESIEGLPAKLHIIMDLKCPDSKMSEFNLWKNLDSLKPTDEIKFVIASQRDFSWAVENIRKNSLDRRFNILFSPAFGLVQPKTLAEWVLDSKIDRCRMQLQQHKYIWHPRAKGV